jgi:hypothetical protein
MSNSNLASRYAGATRLIALGFCCASAAAGDLRIEHVTIVSPEQPRVIRDATVYIQGERITSIYRSKQSSAARSGANDVEVINGKGLYISPGLIDSHVHTGGVPGMGSAQERANPEIARAARSQVPRSYLYFGFTTLIDLISTPEAIAKWNDAGCVRLSRPVRSCIPVGSSRGTSVSRQCDRVVSVTGGTMVSRHHSARSFVEDITGIG